MYKRLMALHEYDVTQLPTIQSPIILLRPMTHSTSIFQEDYGLHKVINVHKTITYTAEQL